MNVRELLAAIAAADISEDTEVYGSGGPLRCVHLEDGVLVLDETGPALVRKLGRFGDTAVLWDEEEPTAA
jgi:hypothetical protein